MSEFTCACCGARHEGLPMDIAHQKPADYFHVPPEERERRVRISADLCSIDDERYFIRAYLPIPVLDHDQVFGWGVWAEVTQGSFFRYLELYEVDGSAEPPFEGLLSAVLPGYTPSTYQLPVEVQLRGADDRPLLRMPALDHQLAREQSQGITMARVGEILHVALPWLFEDNRN